MLQMQSAQQGNRLAPNLTGSDLSSHLGPVGGGGGGLYIQFFYARVKIQSVDPTLNGKYDTRLCVAKVPKGDRLTIATRFIDEEQAAREFPMEYAQFKQYEAVPTSGTPLHELPGISQSQIAYLTIYNVRSIEDLAAMAQEQVSQMGLEAAQAYSVAKKWIISKSDAKPMLDSAQAETVLAAELKSIRDQLADANRTIIEQNAKLSVLGQLGAQGVQQPVAMTQMQGDAVPYQTMNVQAGDADQDDDAPDEGSLFEGGMVGGNEDLDSAPMPTADDPLALGRGRKGRG